MNFKVTEGNIDVFNTIERNTAFHSQLLGLLEKDRCDEADQNILAWSGNIPYRYALDLHAWS
jgi:hypothetical protein